MKSTKMLLCGIALLLTSSCASLTKHVEFLFPPLTEDLKAPGQPAVLKVGDSIPAALITTKFLLADCEQKREKLIKACTPE